MLRNVIGSTIPVELYHYPDEMEDEAVKKELVEKYDITIRAIGQRVGSDENWGESRLLWLRLGELTPVIKNEAFIATDFTEFVYLDSVGAAAVHRVQGTDSRTTSLCVTLPSCSTRLSTRTAARCSGQT